MAHAALMRWTAEHATSGPILGSRTSRPRIPFTRHLVRDDTRRCDVSLAEMALSVIVTVAAKGTARHE